MKKNPVSADQYFLAKLQEQAQMQSRLHVSKVLPRQLEGITAFIGNYPWQTILVLSWLSAIVLFVIKNF